jgi:OOP family OmpA-OmpF porin
MNASMKLFAVVAASLLAACTTADKREYETCIVSSSAVGGVAGATASGAGALAGVVVGAGVGAVICNRAVEEAMPERQSVEPADTDGDGVTDDMDRCPNTPAGAEVDTRGCALDSDGDGVADYRDSCPNTPSGVAVDTRGCPVKDEVVLTVDRLGFAFDSAELDAQSRSALNAAVSVIKSHSAVKMDVVGYTDSSGPEAYNQKLSERRAQAAVDYLVSRGVDKDMLRAVGRGEANPVAGNDSRDGRARNRRVELVVR